MQNKDYGKSQLGYNVSMHNKATESIKVSAESRLC